MRTREFPVLAAPDESRVDRLAADLDDRAARILGYPLLRERQDGYAGEPASSLAVRVGTGLWGRAVADALGRLEAADLVTATPAPTATPEPTEAEATAPPETTAEAPTESGGQPGLGALAGVGAVVAYALARLRRQ